MVLFSRKKNRVETARAVEVVDTIAAGDSYMAGVLAALDDVGQVSRCPLHARRRLKVTHLGTGFGMNSSSDPMGQSGRPYLVTAVVVTILVVLAILAFIAYSL
jgi:hypothetical protein